MTAFGSPQPPVSRKRLLGQVLFAAALLLIAFVLWRRTQPERMTTLSVDTDQILGDATGASLATPVPNGPIVAHYKISGETLFLVGAPSGSTTAVGIQSQSIHAPKMRMLVQSDPDYPFCLPHLWDLAEGELFYAVEPHSRHVSGVLPSTLNASSERSLRTFRLQPQTPSIPPIAGQTRTRITEPPRASKEVRFRQVSLQGGASREVAVLRGAGFCLVGDHVFWIRPAVEETIHVTQGETRRTQHSWLEKSTHSDLMLTSLSDVKTRCIRHGISGSTTLTAAGEGIFWTEPAPYPNPPAYFYARASDGAVYTPISLTNGRSVRPLLEFGGRFYWTITENDSETSDLNNVLMSAKLDGSESRKLLTRADKHLFENVALTVYRGRLYACLETVPIAAGELARAFLCRLDPDQPESAEIVRRLPPEAVDTAVFDGGYLYFLQKGSRSPIHLPLASGEAFTLYRVPLAP